MKQKLIILSACALLISCSLPMRRERIQRAPASAEERIANAQEFYRDRWLQSHDRKYLDRVLKLLSEAKEGDVVVDEVIKSHLKGMRKHANLYRIAFYLFSKNSTPPKRFNRYVKHFGKLNDAIENKMSTAIIKEATWLREWISNNNTESIGLRFKALKPAKFRRIMFDLIKDLEKEFNEKKMTQHALHEFRKKTKLILQIYFYDSLVNGTILRPGKKLDEFINNLGNIHDEYISLILSGGSVEEHEVIKITKKERNDFFKLLGKIKLDFNEDNCTSLIGRLF